MEAKKDNINDYLTWANAGKLVAVVWACVWFISSQLNSDNVRDMQQEQTQKDVTDIKSIVKDIQTDIKNNSNETGSRLNQLEQDVEVLKNQNLINN